MEVIPVTISELTVEIEKLSVGDRLSLLETIVKSLRRETRKPQFPREHLDLFGILKTENPPPSDDDLQKIYLDRLTEKHG